MPKSSYTHQLYWDDEGVIIHPAHRTILSRSLSAWERSNLSTKKYPWGRVRSIRPTRLYPLVDFEASDPNRAIQNILIGGPMGNPTKQSNSRKDARAIGTIEAINETMRRFVEAAEARTTVQVLKSGWAAEPDTKWEAVQGLPGEDEAAGRNVYRQAQAPSEKVIDEFHRERHSSKLEAFGLRILSTLSGKQRGAYEAEAGQLVNPDDLALTETFLYVRVNGKAFRVRRSAYSGSVRIVDAEGATVVTERYYFGRRAHIAVRSSLTGLVELLPAWLGDRYEPEVYKLQSL